MNNYQDPLVTNPMHMGACIQKMYEEFLSDREMTVEEGRINEDPEMIEAYEQMKEYITGKLVMMHDLFGHIIAE